MEKRFEGWVAAVLLNDETSTNAEMLSYFMKAGKMSRREATFYVKQRDRALKEGIWFVLRPYHGRKKR